MMDCDVAIVGAGAAGLALGRELAGHGLTVVILEARGRVGGRALTDTAAFGAPFDRGCAYLHHGKKNPFHHLALRQGAPLVRVKGDRHAAIWLDGREADAAEHDAADAHYARLEKALLSSGKRGEDRAAADVIRDIPRGRWSAMAESWLEFGCDLAEASSLDWYKAEGGDDYLCRTGFGALVARLAEGLAIHLDTEVREIDWTGPQVRLATRRGTVTCATCVVTVPVAVLNAGRPAFRPALPDWKRDALQSMTSAQYLTIGLRFSADTVMPVGANAWLFPWSQAGEGALMLLNDAAGNGICRAEAGGAMASALLDLGERGAIAFVLEQLGEALGSHVRRGFVAGLWTDWRSDPFSRGAWSWARPGASHRRAALAESLDGRLHFAGEACHPTLFATCHGALLSGQRTARQILAQLRR